MDGSGGGGSSESEIAKSATPTSTCSSDHGSSTAVCDGGGGASASSVGRNGAEEGAAVVSVACDQAAAALPSPVVPVLESRNGAGKPEKLAQQQADAAVAPVASTSFKRSGGTGSSSRRSAQKRVVTVPIAEIPEGSRPRSGGGGGAGLGDAAPPPSDSWTWRKYGQKPIKGSPYPRGYYRCSSSKGCPARKQVERSRSDPTMLIVTYASEHNHPWPVPRNNNTHHHGSRQAAAAAHAPAPVPAAKPPSPSSADEDDMEAEYETLVEEAEVEEKTPPVADPPVAAVPTSPGITTTTTTTATTIDASATSTSSPSEEAFSADHSLSDDSTALMPPLGPDGAVDDLCSSWFPVVDSEISLCSTASTAAMMLPFSYDELRADLGGRSGGGCGAGEDDEDALFAGLGELPEFSLVFRRGMMPGTEYAADFTR